MRRLAVLVAVTAGACWPAATAEAGWKMDRAALIAQTVWNSPQPFTIRFADPAAFRVSSLAAGFAAEGGYDIYINPADELTPHWETFCTTVLHEAGHARGYRDPLNVEDPQHSRRTESVMYAHRPMAVVTGRQRSGRRWRRVTYVVGADRRCRERGRPFLERHGLL